MGLVPSLFALERSQQRKLPVAAAILRPFGRAHARFARKGAPDEGIGSGRRKALGNRLLPAIASQPGPQMGDRAPPTLQLIPAPFNRDPITCLHPLSTVHFRFERPFPDTPDSASASSCSCDTSPPNAPPLLPPPLVPETVESLRLLSLPTTHPVASPPIPGPEELLLLRSHSPPSRCIGWRDSSPSLE